MLKSGILALVVLLIANTALAQDKVGVYWNGTYTQNVGTTPVTPGSTTGYLVLQNASNTSGVLGWEACFDIDGPGLFAGWTFPGDAVNAGTEPCFAVGYATPLIYSANMVLGSFTFVATDVGPIMISMEPDWFASLPGEMSYIPADDPGGLIAMTTATGRPEVAGLNGANPLVTVSHDLLDIGGVVVGDSSSGFLTVTNDSDLPFELDISLEALCLSFSLPGGGGPLTIPPYSAQNVEVVFTPIVDRQVFCELDLGPNLNPIQVTGTGALLETSWTVTGGNNIGSVTVGLTRTTTVTVRNTGETTFSIDVAMPDSCGDFSMVYGGGNFSINPNGSIQIPVVFAPTVVGYQQCLLLLGNNPVPDHLLWGTGIEPTPAWDAPLSYDFGAVS
ncbi:MAG: choice-of-anchor D domain-containing protein, partial [Candidatus Krumholzibacteria bacterium]|nr:choice-of-anchor D domain-containing protein [Candidatus Krumholzibacteria bacterium]